ncbi:hypothetical protein CPJ18_01865 [Agrobacterium rosae]|uniref:Uncharacterized protein n=1 Tax=Agrobacterium rosae TaxID=1972867 RepID=A0AAE5S263_9HYPH|nr:hypothetical protein [Agrobacterium rosae]POO54275.1 hypothetical protein CPJ18_01865 [Agrobacterium rosae]
MTTGAQGARDREKARVSRLIDIANRCHGDRWEIDFDGQQTNIIAKRSSGEQDVICTISGTALPEEIEMISGALQNVVMFLDIRRRAIMALKQNQPTQGAQQASRMRDGDFAANAAILCAEPLFQRFLERRDRDGSAIHNKEQADAVLKRLIGMTSKKQLNTQEPAQTAFIDLRADFDIWKRGQA